MGKKFFTPAAPVHINLVWKTKHEVLKKIEPASRPHLVPSDTEKFPIEKQLKEWKKLNPNAEVTLWVDFKENPDAAKALQTSLKTDGIHLKDMQALTSLQQHIEFDSQGEHSLTSDATEDSIPLLEYFETDDWTVIDLIKIAALIHDLETLKSPMSVFTDIDVEAFQLRQETLLKTDPFVFLKWIDKGEGVVANNGFFAFAQNKEAIQALKKWLSSAIDDAFDGRNAFFSLAATFKPISKNTEIPMIDLTFLSSSRQHDMPKTF